MNWIWLFFLILQLIRDSTGKVLVPFYQWSTFLSQFFRTIPNITSYHNFKVTLGKSGVVMCSQYSYTLPLKVNLLKPSEFDVKRQWYLYENIRIHCKSNLAADLTCPKPSLPKPNTATEQPGTPSSADVKRKWSCTLCKEPGHTKKTCPNK